MPRYEVYQGPVGKWVVVRLPPKYQPGDLLPHPSLRTKRFDTRAEAEAEIARLLARKPKRQ
jgi:hypothetical protein